MTHTVLPNSHETRGTNIQGSGIKRCPVIFIRKASQQAERLAAVSSIVGTASLERCACSRAPQMAGSGAGDGRRPRRGGVSVDGHVGETECEENLSEMGRWR